MSQKKCNKCGELKPVDQFSKNNQKRDGRHGTCKGCLSMMRKKWDRKYNASEKAKQAASRYYYSEKGQQTKSTYRTNYEITPEQKESYRVAGRQREKLAKYKARRKRYDATPKGKRAKSARDGRYRKTDKGRFAKRKIEIKRKRQLKSSQCTLTRKQWLEIKQAHDNRCAYCNRKMERLEMDHVIPLSKGGTHTADNVVPSCRTCNASKGNRLLPTVDQSGS